MLQLPVNHINYTSRYDGWHTKITRTASFPGIPKVHGAAIGIDTKLGRLVKYISFGVNSPAAESSFTIQQASYLSNITVSRPWQATIIPRGYYSLVFN